MEVGGEEAGGAGRRSCFLERKVPFITYSIVRFLDLAFDPNLVLRAHAASSPGGVTCHL